MNRFIHQAPTTSPIEGHPPAIHIPPPVSAHLRHDEDVDHEDDTVVDPFEQFWETVEHLVHQQGTSTPVALMSAPLQSATTSKTKRPDNSVVLVPRPSFSPDRSAQPANRRQPTPPALGIRRGQSVPMLSSEQRMYAVSGKTMEELVMENAELKRTVDLLTRKLSEMQKLATENAMLKSSIIQFRQEFRSHAQAFVQNDEEREMERLRREVERLRVAKEE